MHIATIATTNAERLSRTEMKQHVRKLGVAMSSIIKSASSHSISTISLPINAIFANILLFSKLRAGGYNEPINSNSAVNQYSIGISPEKITVHNNYETLTERFVKPMERSRHVITYSINNKHYKI